MTHLPQNLDKLRVLHPASPAFEPLFASPGSSPFGDDTMSLLQRLSAALLQAPEAKAFPDVITFAFWCRKASLAGMKQAHESSAIRLGRGTVFHITPSNVPVNFAYSLAAGMLSGNANVVRLPTTEYPQVAIISAALRGLFSLPEFAAPSARTALVRYERDTDLTAFFSRNADVRIIWGGDDAIHDIRQAPLPPRSFDIAFADRYSLCAINADAYVATANPALIAAGFYNDAYLFDQNACTSPHLVVWLGKPENVKAAKKSFWGALHTQAAGKYVLQPVLAVDKYAALCGLSIRQEGVRIIRTPDNLIVRAELASIPEDVADYRCRGGYFLEYTASTLDDLLRPVNRKYQTLSYFGFPQQVLRDLIRKSCPSGIDRIVPIGRTMEFSLVWDGYDLISTLSRICSIL